MQCMCGGGSVSEPTYELLDEGRSIRCHRCGLTSQNPNDVEQRYCGRCKLFHEDIAELLAERTALRARVTTLESIIQGAGEQLDQGEIPLHIAIAQLHTELMSAWRRAATAEATAAALRQAAAAYLDCMKSKPHGSDELGAYYRLMSVLATDAGAAVLAELEAARTLAGVVASLPGWAQESAIEAALTAYEAARAKGAGS